MRTHGRAHCYNCYGGRPAGQNTHDEVAIDRARLNGKHTKKKNLLFLFMIYEGVLDNSWRSFKKKKKKPVRTNGVNVQCVFVLRWNARNETETRATTCDTSAARALVRDTTEYNGLLLPRCTRALRFGASKQRGITIRTRGTGDRRTVATERM